MPTGTELPNPNEASYYIDSLESNMTEPIQVSIAYISPFELAVFLQLDNLFSWPSVHQAVAR